MTSRTPHVLALLSLLLTPAIAQVPENSAGTWAIPAPPSVLAAHGLREGTLQDLPLRSRGSGYETTVVLHGAEHLLRFEPHGVRAPGFRVLEVDASGTAIPVTPPPERSYRGPVVTAPGSVCAFTVEANGTLDGMVLLGDGWFGIEPLSVAERTLHGMDYLVFHEDGRDLHGVSCGAHGAPANLPVATNPALDAVGSLETVEIAIDCDYDYYQRYGSSANTVTSRVNDIMNRVDVIYQRDVTIAYQITTVIVRTSPTYTWNGDMGNLLAQFESTWAQQHQNVPRDMAHLFTGKGSFSGVIGIANVGTVCYGAYGVSKAYSSSNTTNAGLVAHETGHNFSANHCDGTSPCWIMCSGLGGCDRSVTAFGTTSIQRILAFKRSLRCLTGLPNPPVISAITPASVTAAVPGQVTITGTDLDDVTSLTLNGQPITFQIVSETTLRVEPAMVNPLGPHAIVATNPFGPSNAMNLTFVETDPPRLWATPGLSGTQDFKMYWGSNVGDLYGLALTLNDGLLFPFQGFDILLNGYVIFGGALDAAGTGSFFVPAPPSAFGNVLRSQIWVIDPVALTFEASPVALTLMV